MQINSEKYLKVLIGRITSSCFLHKALPSNFALLEPKNIFSKSTFSYFKNTSKRVLIYYLKFEKKKKEKKKKRFARSPVSCHLSLALILY